MLGLALEEPLDLRARTARVVLVQQGLGQDEPRGRVSGVLLEAPAAERDGLINPAGAAIRLGQCSVGLELDSRASRASRWRMSSVIGK